MSKIDIYKVMFVCAGGVMAHRPEHTTRQSLEGDLIKTQTDYEFVLEGANAEDWCEFLDEMLDDSVNAGLTQYFAVTDSLLHLLGKFTDTEQAEEAADTMLGHSWKYIADAQQVKAWLEVMKEHLGWYSGMEEDEA